MVCDGGGDCKRCVRAEFKRIRKMKCKNESKNDYFCTTLQARAWFYFSKMVQK